MSDLSKAWKTTCKHYRAMYIYYRARVEVQINNQCLAEGRPLLYPETGLTMKTGLK